MGLLNCGPAKGLGDRYVGPPEITDPVNGTVGPLQTVGPAGALQRDVPEPAVGADRSQIARAR